MDLHKFPAIYNDHVHTTLIIWQGQPSARKLELQRHMSLQCMDKLNRYRHISVPVRPPIPQTCLKACKVGNLALILLKPRRENRRFSEFQGRV